MGYYMIIQTSSLKGRLPNLPTEFIPWKQENDGSITPTDTSFKWYDTFEEELLLMVQAGITGEIVVTGEEGDYSKYVLKDNKVEMYEGTVVYNNKPDNVITAENNGRE